MDLLFARQPIFNRADVVYGYELLYRDVGTTAYAGTDGDAATSNVMIASFLSMGINELSGKRKAFINFTENMLLLEVATLFPKDQIVVEILEDVQPTEAVVDACRKLKEQGYTIALDDFIFRPGYDALIELADIIKVDFMLLQSEFDREFVVKHFGNGHIQFLAEKVETREDYQMAVDIGYTLFQGYYFSKPVIESSKGIPPSKMNHMNLIKHLEGQDPEFEEIASIIEKDVAFTYEILKIANTSYYYRGSKITSVRQAAVMLGLDELKKWAFITMFRKIGGRGQDAIVNLSVQRAKALELLAQRLGLEDHRMEFFTLGMMSMIDVLTGAPMETLLLELPLTEEAKKILLGKFNGSKLSVCYKLILAYEKGDWDLLFDYSKKYAINVEDVAQAYFNAVLWTNDFDLN